MKKIIVLIYLVFIILNCFSSQFNKYNLELVTNIPLGEEVEKIGIDTSPGVMDFTFSAFAFDKDGKLYVADIIKNRLAIYDNNFNYLKEIKNIAYYKKIEIDNENNIIGTNDSIVEKIDSNGNKLFNIDLYKSPIKKKYTSGFEALVIDNAVFVQLKEGTKKVFITNNNNIYDISKIDSEIKNINQSRVIKNYSEIIIKNDMVYSNDKLLTRVYKEYFNNIKKENIYKTNSKYEKTVDSNSYKKIIKNTVYIGMDNEDNIYWYSKGIVLVHNKFGSLIDFFTLNNIENTINFVSYPAIHPNGDIYFMGNDGKKSGFLYKIKRVW